MGFGAESAVRTLDSFRYEFHLTKRFLNSVFDLLTRLLLGVVGARVGRRLGLVFAVDDFISLF